MTNEKYLIYDSETCNEIDTPIAYDMGGSVIDENGNSYESFSFVIKEVFEDEELMQSAYFADKIPQYIEEITNGTRKLVSLAYAKRFIRNLMNKYNITIVVAHNCRFDYKSSNTTLRYMTKSKQRFFFPYGTQYADTLKMSRKVFGEDENYKNFCIENGYLTKRNQLRFTAEIIYRFLIGDNNFTECHTGFEDTEIEKLIFSECRKRNPEIDGLLW